MTTITYRFKRRRRRTILTAATLVMLGLTQLVILVSLAPSGDTPWLDALAEDMLFTLSGLLLLVVYVIVVAMTLRPGAARREFLKLDDEGLTYGNLFGRNRWHWSDLSTFALREQLDKSAYVTFALPKKPDWTVNQSPTESTAVGPKAMIEDIYDRPIAEIVAKLNEFRDRALGAQEAH